MWSSWYLWGAPSIRKLRDSCEAILFLEPKISMQSVQHCASRRRTRSLTNDEDRDYNWGAEDCSGNVCDVLIVGGVLMCYVNNSSASTIQACLVLCSPTVRQVSLLLRHNEVLQSIAASIGISNFLRAFFIESLNSSSSIAHFCFPLRFDQTCVSTFLAIIRRSLRSFVFSSLSPSTMCIHPVAFHSMQWILWSQSTHLTIHDLHQHSSSRTYFPTSHLGMYWCCW